MKLPSKIKRKDANHAQGKLYSGLSADKYRKFLELRTQVIDEISQPELVRSQQMRAKIKARVSGSARHFRFKRGVLVPGIAFLVVFLSVAIILARPVSENLSSPKGVLNLYSYHSGYHIFTHSLNGNGIKPEFKDQMALFQNISGKIFIFANNEVRDDYLSGHISLYSGLKMRMRDQLFDAIKLYFFEGIEVAMIGTAFMVEKSEKSLRLSVIHGKVKCTLLQKGKSNEISAGEFLEIKNGDFVKGTLSQKHSAETILQNFYATGRFQELNGLVRESKNAKSRPPGQSVQAKRNIGQADLKEQTWKPDTRIYTRSGSVILGKVLHESVDKIDLKTNIGDIVIEKSEIARMLPISQ